MELSELPAYSIADPILVTNSLDDYNNDGDDEVSCRETSTLSIQSFGGYYFLHTEVSIFFLNRAILFPLNILALHWNP